MIQKLSGVFMKHIVGIGLLVLVALVVRFLGAYSRVGLDVYVHATYYVIPIRMIGFWLLIGIASAWFLIVAYKFARHVY
jgi:hypothetical protein